MLLSSSPSPTRTQSCIVKRSTKPKHHISGTLNSCNFEPTILRTLTVTFNPRTPLHDAPNKPFTTAVFHVRNSLAIKAPMTRNQVSSASFARFTWTPKVRRMMAQNFQNEPKRTSHYMLDFGVQAHTKKPQTSLASEYMTDSWKPRMLQICGLSWVLMPRVSLQTIRWSNVPEDQGAWAPLA